MLQADRGLVEWVCERAAANHSPSRCSGCNWFHLRELTPNVTAGRLPTPECSTVRPRLAWFMCITPATDALSLKHLEYAKAAIVSARINAPTLAPYIVLIAHDDAELSSTITAAEFDEANSRFRSWLRTAGVRLLPHRLSFYDQLPMKSRARRTSTNPNLNVGAFGRLDMGIIVDAIRNELFVRGLDIERILYTDTDVLFSRDVEYDSLAALPLPTFAAGTEVFSPALNTGVMLINASAWLLHYAAMMEYGQRRRFRFLSYDQTWVQQYFKWFASRAGWARGWETLDDAAYNARAFMHPIRPSRRRQPVLPRLWHWHGFKPRDVECWHRAIHTGTWPVRAWRNTVPGCTGKTRPRCIFMPVHNSGCRYFGRLTAVLGLTPCYLRTYTYLLQQHRKMMSIAHDLEQALNVGLSDSERDCEWRAAARVAIWENKWSRGGTKALSSPPVIRRTSGGSRQL